MLDMPSPGSFQNIELPKYRPLNLSPTGHGTCEAMWFRLGKIEEVQFKVSNV